MGELSIWWWMFAAWGACLVLMVAIMAWDEHVYGGDREE